MSPGKPSSKGAAGRRAALSHPAKSSYLGIVSQAITKIRDEPFLFVIAVIALLIGFTVAGSRLGRNALNGCHCYGSSVLPNSKTSERSFFPV